MAEWLYMYKFASVVKKYLKICSRGLCNCFSAEYVNTPLPRRGVAHYFPLPVVPLLPSPGITLLRGSADGASSGGHADGPTPGRAQCSSMWALSCTHLATCLHSTQVSPAHQLGTTSPSPFQPGAVPRWNLPTLASSQ